MVIVTDLRYRLKNGELQQGYSMDGYLAENLAPIPSFLKKDFDLVGIITGSGKVRVGKSYFTCQIGYYIAWCIAGGEMNLKRNDEGKYINPIVKKHPTKPINFSLDNVTFSPEELMKKAQTFPKNSVIIYDEGRAGLDSKNTMTALNKLLENFFQECGQYNHVILIVLPNFFNLSEMIACGRSTFLANVFLDESYSRGNFNFYNEKQKDFLYYMGKKKVGLFGKYASTTPSFWGSFPDFLPFDAEEYHKRKLKALKNKRLTTREQRVREKFMGMVEIFKQETGFSSEETAEKLGSALNQKITHNVIENALSAYSKYQDRDHIGGTSD